jgi:hypothetical protein
MGATGGIDLEPPDLRQVAYRQAARVVASICRRAPFQSVTIVAEGDRRGSVEGAVPWRDELKAYVDDGGKRHLGARRRLVILQAGAVAETRLTGRPRVLDGADWHDALALSLFRPYRRLPRVEQQLGAARRDAERLLDRPHNWAAVVAVADALLVGGRLEEDTARSIVRQAQRRVRMDG